MSKASNIHRAGYSVAETAQSLGITPHAAYQAITAGDITTTRVGSRIYIPAQWFRDRGLDSPAGVGFISGERLEGHGELRISARTSH